MREKNAFIAAAAVIIICAIAGGLIMFRINHNSKERITEFESILLTESTMRGSSEFEIINKGETSEIALYGIYYNSGERERRPKEKTSCNTSAVIEILNECGVLSWEGFHGKHPKHVSDGTMFTFEAKVNGDTLIKADGSENFPKNYRIFREWLYESIRDTGE